MTKPNYFYPLADILKGSICILTASLLFGLLPSITLNSYQGGINVLTMQSLKYLLVTAILLPFSLCRYFRYFPSPKTALKLLAASGILYAAQALLYAYSVTRIPVALSVLLLFTYPILVSLMEMLAGREKLSLKSGLLLASVFASLCFALFRPNWEISITGVLCALAASLSYAFYVLVLNHLSHTMPAPLTNTFVNAGPAITITLFSCLAGKFQLNFAPFTWWSILFNVLLGGIAGYYLWLKGLKLLGPVAASALSMTEPLFAILASAVLLGQTVTSNELIGGICFLVLLTQFTRSLKKSNFSQKNRKNGDHHEKTN